ncbi:ethanolamine utilization protein EutM [Paenibacillus sp. PastF-1]|nr:MULTISPECIES: BMC domain-containing protein [unclassified Paenibacillus]MDF9844288.1 ethanolamine utilization protein EutM [Paenibacillus sp. PastF-2]MDF9850923.1 ethanolamine utilization protein EutM [Paenibacillus sp. PastM-2]MDF9857463.1 ethanolamine utilization protein EutM [Paenibacillus sp. PastF-1]MDH6482761.1 ethanolamine utilization protein EutM [Paenibacillus sp. PastH-2]MDH6510187.1 ethanolamine utilization protein EutM [Paenibacillus sp. PastM-3]
MQALGLIETLGFTTAVSAADAALKAADVQLVAVERVIGVGGSLGVTLHFSGDVAAVTASVEAGQTEGRRIGTVVSAHVIAKAHSDVTGKILGNYLLPEGTAIPAADGTSATSASAMDTPAAAPPATAAFPPPASAASAAAALPKPANTGPAKPDQAAGTDKAPDSQDAGMSSDSPD